jgi:hypothetical protein
MSTIIYALTLFLTFSTVMTPEAQVEALRLSECD